MKDKIGKFGLGFNSVYNMTDIPSVISQSKLVYLDPNIKYLKNRIKNASQPGICINFNKLTLNDLANYSDQFKPYENVFGCTPFVENFCYNSTLFRLPLRKEPSKISVLIYNKDSQIEELFKILYQNADRLLLFSQSIRKIEFYILEDNEENTTADTSMKLLFEFEKNACNYLRRHDQIFENCFSTNSEPDILDFITQSCILKASLKCKSKLETSMIVKNSIKAGRANMSVLFSGIRIEDEIKDAFWLVVSSFNSKYLVENDPDFAKFIPCVGMAVEIEK